MIMKTYTVLLTVFFILAALICQTQPPQHEKAEQFYAQYLAVYQNENSGKTEVKNALHFLNSAFQLDPKVFKYSYALGAGYKYISDYTNAKIWYQKSLALTSNQTEKAGIEKQIGYCNMKLMEAKLATRTTNGPGVLVSFIMKGSTNELQDNIIENFAKALPETLVGNETGPLTDILKSKIGDCDIYVKNEFLVASLSSQRNAKEHYERGIADFDAYFKQTFSFQKPTHYVTILLTEDPMELVDATNRLYPEAHLQPYAPFLGYFNRKDNLIAANGGMYGYGTLLHELMHSNINADFPDAPVWINEGLCSLYERTEWQGNRLIGLPNWRFDRVKPSDFHNLEQLAENINIKNLSEIRMLLMYVDHINKIGEFYHYIKTNKESLDLSKCFQHFDITNTKWEEFITNTLSEYNTELYASMGSLSNPEEIKYIQEALNTILGKQLKVDGFWGSGSENALIEFQQKFGLKPDGQYGAKTRDMIDKQYNKMLIK